MPRILDLRTVHEGWSRFSIAIVEGPDGRSFPREVEDHGEAVAVLPYDPGRRVAMLVRQFRAAVLVAGGDPHLLEAPAGILDEDDPMACARREAMEEVGLRLGSLEFVARTWPMAGISTERLHLYLAPYSAADRIGKGGGLATENELITLAEMPLPELAAMADDGRIDDLKTLLLVQTLRLRQPVLFA